jgi:hypothetical protein
MWIKVQPKEHGEWQFEAGVKSLRKQLWMRGDGHSFQAMGGDEH